MREHDQPAPPPGDPESDLKAALERVGAAAPPPTATPRVQLRELAILCYALGHTQWLYRVPHGHERSIMAEGYFADCVDIFALGDIVTLVAKSGCAAQRSVCCRHPVRLAPLAKEF